MFGKIPRVNSPASRKQLLIAESELNRAQLLGAMTTLAAEVSVIAGRAKSFGLIASSVAVLITGLNAFRRDQRTDADTKPSWLKNIFKLVGLGFTIWPALRSPRRDHPEP